MHLHFQKVKKKHCMGKVLDYNRHESAIKEKTRKSSQSELHKREALNQRSLGSDGCCEAPSGSRAEPWWWPRGQGPRKISRIFL